MSELHLTGAEGHKKLQELIEGIHITMLTTVNEDGTLHGRPMATQSFEKSGPFAGTLWFFTRIDSRKVDEILDDQQVLLNYSDPGDSKFVAVQGSARVSRDKAKIHELWTPMLKAWFAGGEEDPEVALIEVKVTSAEFWEANSSKLVRLGKTAIAMVTGAKTDVGDSGTIAV